jgi:hypothetical protein
MSMTDRGHGFAVRFTQEQLLGTIPLPEPYCEAQELCSSQPVEQSHHQRATTVNYWHSTTRAVEYDPLIQMPDL